MDSSFANTTDELDKLALPVWLTRLIGYAHLTTVKEAGDKAAGHIVVKRYHYKRCAKKVAKFTQLKGISKEALVHW